MSIDFVWSDEEAEKRYKRTKNKDPFPQISPALLNSADIVDYVAATGMITPFRPYDNLKSASYVINLLGSIIFWNGDGIKVSKKLRDNESFDLERNSIAFVQLEPYFRVPNYIALRFNLKIKHVYRGLLLGTGPLIDPGYVGPIYIPLHNLTNETYTFTGGEELIWMEFTKLSPLHRWDRNASEPRFRRGWFVPFPQEKLNERKTLEDFLQHANPNGSIRSSIPIEIKTASQNAKISKDAAAQSAEGANKAAEELGKATDEFNKSRKFWYKIGVGGLVILAVALCALFLDFRAYTTTISQTMFQEIRAINDKVIKIEGEKSKETATDYQQMKMEIDRLQVEVKRLQDVQEGGSGGNKSSTNSVKSKK